MKANTNLRAIDASFKQAARSMAGDLRKVSVDARDTAEAIQSMKPPAGGDSIFSGLLGGIAKATLAAFVSAAPVNISTYVDGQKVFDRFGKELVRQEVRRTNLKDAKRNMEIMRRLT